jgi:hypothetical protein
MFRKHEKTTLNVMTNVEVGGGPYGRDFDPVVAWLGCTSFFLMSGYFLYNTNTKRNNAYRHAEQSNCNLTIFGPQTRSCTEINNQLSMKRQWSSLY